LAAKNDEFIGLYHAVTVPSSTGL